MEPVVPAKVIDVNRRAFGLGRDAAAKQEADSQKSRN